MVKWLFYKPLKYDMLYTSINIIGSGITVSSSEMPDDQMYKIQKKG
jgi:hypothetical protein